MRSGAKTRAFGRQQKGYRNTLKTRTVTSAEYMQAVRANAQVWSTSSARVKRVGNVCSARVHCPHFLHVLLTRARESFSV